MSDVQIEYKYTKISDLIAELTAVLQERGDLPVTVRHATPVFTNVMPYYYDGGYTVRTADGAYVTSRDYERGDSDVRPGLPETFVDLASSQPNADDWNVVNGRSVREIDPDTWQYLEEQEAEERLIFSGQLVKYRIDNHPSGEGNNRCYMQTAYLPSGEEGRGPSMADAKAALIRAYQEKHGGGS